MKYRQFKPIRWRLVRPLGAAALLALAFAWVHERPPRPWTAGQVPIAFWAWQIHTPAVSDVQAARDECGATCLFLHAGQIDLEAGKLHRIRAVQGSFPRDIPLHLVYNATRSLLAEFEHLDARELADEVWLAYEEDCSRAAADGATITGLQLDWDVPTRLLRRYEGVVRQLRGRLTQDRKLSITGLPAWMDSRDVGRLLDSVDFWIPQCYGARLPERLDTMIPISSPQSVASAMDQARRLGRPFYAGLAAYGYAAHYSISGSLLGLRGDLDPDLLANNPDFELLQRRPFAELPEELKDRLPIASEWRYVYRALRETALDGSVMRKGESLALDLPTAESLRASARAVRERAGKDLLGICVFRLPAAGDPTTLTAREVSTALADISPAFEIQTRGAIESGGAESRRYLALEVSNAGSARPLLGSSGGSEGVNVDLRIAPGTVGAVELTGFTSIQPLCDSPRLGLERAAEPCRAARATRLSLTGAALKPGAVARASLELKGPAPEQLPIAISMSADDGRFFREERILPVVARSPQ